MEVQTGNDPAVQIWDHLTESGWRLLFNAPVGIEGHATKHFEFWAKGGRVVIVQIYTRGGVEVFAPVSDDNKIQSTLEAIDRLV